MYMNGVGWGLLEKMSIPVTEIAELHQPARCEVPTTNITVAPNFLPHEKKKERENREGYGEEEEDETKRCLQRLQEREVFRVFHQRIMEQKLSKKKKKTEKNGRVSARL